MAISTFKTFLMHKKEASTYEKLVDITEFPDLGSDPELLETTTTSDRMKTYILGILGKNILLDLCFMLQNSIKIIILSNRKRTPPFNYLLR